MAKLLALALGDGVERLAVRPDWAGPLVERLALEQAFRRLSPRQQRVVLLAAAGFTCRQVAARLGISYQAAAQALARARRRLAELAA